MRLYFLGIGGTFMGSLAVLASELGHDVSGVDENIYAPMSTQLKENGIDVHCGYSSAQLPRRVDMVIIGNAMRRGNCLVEEILNQGIPYVSGPTWLYQNVLQGRQVLAISGTHGKTTTSSMLAWILDFAGLAPGFLIGGIPKNFTVSSRLGSSPIFVIEADEYDTAFFDKRSKFLHYRPSTLVINNLEYDHADIFPSLQAIQTQFHNLIRTVPGNGKIIYNAQDENIPTVFSKGCWSDVEPVAVGITHPGWSAQLIEHDASVVDIFESGEVLGRLQWQLVGQHNVNNALSAIAAARNVGVDPRIAIEALSQFKSVARRLEVKTQASGVTIYDDFAHHPTAIETTLSAMRARVGNDRVIAILELGSYTMRSGIHKKSLVAALHDADAVYCLSTQPLNWSPGEMLNTLTVPAEFYSDESQMLVDLISQIKTGDHVVIMSNRGVTEIHDALADHVNQKVEVC